MLLLAIVIFEMERGWERCGILKRARVLVDEDSMLILVMLIVCWEFNRM